MQWADFDLLQIAKIAVKVAWGSFDGGFEVHVVFFEIETKLQVRTSVMHSSTSKTLAALWLHIWLQSWPEFKLRPSSSAHSRNAIYIHVSTFNGVFVVVPTTRLATICSCTVARPPAKLSMLHGLCASLPWTSIAAQCDLPSGVHVHSFVSHVILKHVGILKNYFQKKETHLNLMKIFRHVCHILQVSHANQCNICN